MNTYYLLTSLTLGDGYIQNRKKSKKAYLDIAHHYKHKDYIDWKKSILDSININSHVCIKNRNGNLQYRVLSKSYEQLEYIRKRLYKNKGYKWFSRKNVKMLDDLALAILWMDDGCINKQINKKSGYIYSCGTISTESFDYKSQENIVLWLQEKFNIESRIGKSKQNFRICLNRTNTKKLIEIVSKYVEKIESMKYKIDLSIGF